MKSKNCVCNCLCKQLKVWCAHSRTILHSGICTTCSYSSCGLGQFLSGCGGESPGACAACALGTYSVAAGTVPYDVIFENLSIFGSSYLQLSIAISRTVLRRWILLPVAEIVSSFLIRGCMQELLPVRPAAPPPAMQDSTWGAAKGLRPATAQRVHRGPTAARQANIATRLVHAGTLLLT